MKRIIFLCLFILFFLVGCKGNEEFNPVYKQVIHKIEVYSEYDPLTFISNTTTDKHTIVVENNPIDNTKLGNYNITYIISNDEGDSATQTYLIAVVDETKPVIQVISDITVTVNQELSLSHFISVNDNLDGNIIDNVQIIGEYDLSTVGEYSVQLQVADSSNNMTTKTVTIYVTEDESIDISDNSIVGIYKVNYMDEDDLNPYLVLSNDDTYSLLINYCVGLRTFTGTYSVSGHTLILESDGLTFDDDDPSSSSITMTINEDGNLIYENNYGACSPIHKDIFIKQ